MRASQKMQQQKGKMQDTEGSRNRVDAFCTQIPKSLRQAADGHGRCFSVPWIVHIFSTRPGSKSRVQPAIDGVDGCRSCISVFRFVNGGGSVGSSLNEHQFFVGAGCMIVDSFSGHKQLAGRHPQDEQRDLCPFDGGYRTVVR